MTWTTWNMERDDLTRLYSLVIAILVREVHRQVYKLDRSCLQAHITACTTFFTPSFSVDYSEAGKKVDEFGGVSSDRTLIFSCRRLL